MARSTTPPSSGPNVTDEAEAPTLRVDAARNRDRILTAARAVFARQGLSVSMATVAREAGVGQATLYRRFPTRDDLVTAVFANTMDTYATATTTALADPDPWHAFVTYVYAVCALQAADLGFSEVLTLTFPTAKALERQRAVAYDGFLEIIRRAQDAGRLRADFTPEDMVLLQIANAGVIAATHDAAPNAWRRIVAYMLQAFAAHDTNTELPPSPTPHAVFRAMLRLDRSSDQHHPRQI